MRWKIEVTEIDRLSVGSNAIDLTVYTQVVDVNPIKTIQKALSSMRARKSKEKPNQVKLT